MPSIAPVAVNPFTIAAAVTILVGLLRPFVEALPFARPGSSTHDATLQLLNVALNTGGVLALASATGQLSGGAWLTLLIQALTQSGGSHLIYHAVTSAKKASSSSPSAPAAPFLPAMPRAAMPSAPAAPAVASAPSPATYAALSAQRVADAMNAALAAQAQAQQAQQSASRT